MSIFSESFERTENSDEIFSILGRALVIATRFDSMCKGLARAIDFKNSRIEFSDSDFDSLVKKTLESSSNLSKSIKKLGFSDGFSVILHDARKARNAVAHDLAVGLEGCIDTKIDEEIFLREVWEHVFDLAYGDALISVLIHKFNGENSIRSEVISTYRDKIVSWVIEK